jgi:hypothetical protein
LPEFPEIAELPLLVASPVLPESAFPEVAPVLLEALELALPDWPPLAEPEAVLAPEFPEVA